MDLKKKSILEDLLLKGYPELLDEILQDEFYSFNKEFVFQYILKLINDKLFQKFQSNLSKTWHLINEIINKKPQKKTPDLHSFTNQ